MAMDSAGLLVGSSFTAFDIWVLDTVTLRFAINRQGKILYHSLKKRSNWDLLNQAVKRMMNRSSPVPPIPPEIGKNEMTFTVPVRFELRSRS